MNKSFSLKPDCFRYYFWRYY